MNGRVCKERSNNAHGKILKNVGNIIAWGDQKHVNLWWGGEANKERRVFQRHFGTAKRHRRKWRINAGVQICIIPRKLTLWGFCRSSRNSYCWCLWDGVNNRRPNLRKFVHILCSFSAETNHIFRRYHLAWHFAFLSFYQGEQVVKLFGFFFVRNNLNIARSKNVWLVWFCNYKSDKIWLQNNKLPVNCHGQGFPGAPGSRVYPGTSLVCNRTPAISSPGSAHWRNCRRRSDKTICKRKWILLLYCLGIKAQKYEIA